MFKTSATVRSKNEQISHAKHPDRFCDAETEARKDAALKRMPAAPKPHKDSKLGKRRESGAS